MLTLDKELCPPTDGSRKREIRWTKKQTESVFENVDLFPKSAKKLKVTIRLIYTEFEELVRRIDGDASSADYIDADDMVPFC